VRDKPRDHHSRGRRYANPFPARKSNTSTNGPTPWRSRTSLSDLITPSTSGQLVHPGSRPMPWRARGPLALRNRYIAILAGPTWSHFLRALGGESERRRSGVRRLAQTTLSLAPQVRASFEACSDPGRPLDEQVKASGFAQENTDRRELPLTVL
jgi:hypothetical protein